MENAEQELIIFFKEYIDAIESKKREFKDSLERQELNSNNVRDFIDSLDDLYLNKLRPEYFKIKTKAKYDPEYDKLLRRAFIKVFFDEEIQL